MTVARTPGQDAAEAEPRGTPARPAAADEPTASGQRAARLRARLPAYVLAAGLFAVYATFSLLRAWHVQTAAYDLGIFTQAVKSYAGFNAPMVEIKGAGFNLLGDHFSPALVVLAPFYRLWPSPDLLLVAQALLLAGSSIPITRLAARRLGTPAGLAIGAAYGLSWGIQGAGAFDFHEVALGVPLIALAMVALAEERWWPAVGWAAGLVLVKEDLGVTVAAVGGYLLLRRQWRPGATALVTGVGAFLLTTLWIIPALDHIFGTYRYWGVVTDGPANTGGPPGLGDVGSLLLHLPQLSVTPPGKLGLLAWVFGVTCFLALRSPLALVAVPTLLWRLVSANPLYWSTGQVHYNAILMPVVFVALVDALPKLAPLWRGVRFAPAAVLAVALVTLPRFSYGELARTDLRAPSPHAAAAREVAGLVPDGARVSAGNYLVPLVVSRCEVMLFPHAAGRTVDYYLVDTTNLQGVPGGAEVQRAGYADLVARHLPLVAARDGIELYRAGP